MVFLQGCCLLLRRHGDRRTEPKRRLYPYPSLNTSPRAPPPAAFAELRAHPLRLHGSAKRYNVPARGGFDAARNCGKRLTCGFVKGDGVECLRFCNDKKAYFLAHLKRFLYLRKRCLWRSAFFSCILFGLLEPSVEGAHADAEPGGGLLPGYVACQVVFLGPLP